MHPKILTALTLAVLGTGAAHAAPTNSTPARAAAQTANQTAPTLLQQNLLTLIKAGQAMEAETQVKQAEIEKKEKSLSVLMGKILEVPLKPLGESVNALSGDLERTNRRISEIFEALEASTGIPPNQ